MTASATDLARSLDNLTLKEWLREVGPVRRKEILQKLKVELEGLGLPKLRHGLRHGLIHLFSECSVIVERLPPTSAFVCNKNPEESCQNEKVTRCNKHDRKKGTENLDDLSFEGKGDLSNSQHPLSAEKDVLIDRVLINTNPDNCSTNPMKSSFSSNSTEPLFHKNVGAEDVSFKTPYLPSTNKNLQSHRAKPCPLSRKKLPEHSFPSSAMSKSRTKECSSSENDSTNNNCLVLKNSSENKVCLLAKTPIVEQKDSKDKINSKRLKDNRQFSNRDKPKSPKRRYSDTFLNTTTSRKKVSRSQRSGSTGENVVLKSNNSAYSEKENLEKEFQELLTKIRELESQSASSSVEKSSENSSFLAKSSGSPCELLQPSLVKEKVALPVKINLRVIKDLTRLGSQKIKRSKNERHQHIATETKVRLMPSDSNHEAQESTNYSQATTLKERRKSSHNEENECSRRKPSRIEEAESVKKKKKKPVKRKKSLKSVFRELFGDEEESGVQNNVNKETKRRKVDSRDSCDSGAYCSEASPISVTAYSKDVDTGEIFSPDSTKLTGIFASEPKEITVNKTKVPDGIADNLVINEKESPLSLDNLQKETSDERCVLPDSSTCISDDEVTLVECRPRSPEETIPDDPDVPSKELDNKVTDLASPSKSDSSGPSDDTLSKAGIVRDLEKDSYVFSSDDINILLNILSENPTRNTVEENPPEEPTGENEETDPEKDCADSISTENTNEALVPDDEIESDIEIVLEKGPSASRFIPDLEKTVPAESNQTEETVSVIEPPKITFPRLRVKDLSELGCPRRCPTPSSPLDSTDGSLNSQIRQQNSPNPVPSATWTIPPPEYSAPSTSNPTPAVLYQPNPNIQRVNRSNDFASAPNQVVNVAIVAAQRLISLINPLTVPETPQISHYYNVLISLLGDISNATLFLRNSYVSRPYGLLSPDLLGYNLNLNKKLRHLSKFLHIAFEENTMQFVLDNYNALTTRPILNKDELIYIMSLQYSDIDANQEHQGHSNSARISTVSQILLPAPGTLQQCNADQNVQEPPRIMTFSPQSQPLPMPAGQPQTRKTNSKKKHKVKGFTNEQYIIFKAQINAYNTLAKKFNQSLPSPHVANIATDTRVHQSNPNPEDLSGQTSRIVQSNSNLNQQETRVLSPRNVQKSNNSNPNRLCVENSSLHSQDSTKSIAFGAGKNNTVVFRMRNPSQVSQVTERDNKHRSGLVITPVTTAVSSISNNSDTISSKALPGKSVSSESGLAPFPKGLSITAVLPTAKPSASTSDNSTKIQTRCTITALTHSASEIAPPATVSPTLSMISSSAAPLITVPSATPSVIVSSATPSKIVSSATPPMIVSSALPPMIVSSVTPSMIISHATPSMIVSSATPSVIVSSAAPSKIVSPATPPMIVSPTISSKICSSATPSVIVSSATPSKIVSPATPPMIVSSALPPMIVSSVTPSMIISHATPSMIVSSATPSETVSLATPPMIVSSAIPSMIVSPTISSKICSSATPSVIVSSATPSNIVSPATPSMIVSSALPSMIVSSAACSKTVSPVTSPMTVSSASPPKIVSSATPSMTVSSPILSSAISAPSSSVPFHRLPLITLNQTRVTTPKQNNSHKQNNIHKQNTKLYMRLNAPASVASPSSNSAGSAVVSLPIAPSPVVSLPIVAVTILSAPIVSPVPSVPHQGNPLNSNQTRVVTNPSTNFSLPRNMIASPTKAQTTLKTSLQTAIPVPKITIQSSNDTLAKFPASKTSYNDIPKKLPAPKTAIPSFNLPKQNKIVPSPVKEKLATIATNSASSTDSGIVETEFRSMPSLSPDPSPPLERNNKVSPPIDKNSENTPELNEDDDEGDLLCFQCKKKSTVVCGRCQEAIYCSKLCQEKHWQEVHHETCQDSSVSMETSTETKDN